MDENEIDDLLKKIPGSRRGVNGIIIDDKDGNSFHLTGIYTPDEMEGLSNEEVFFLAFCSRNEIIRMRALRTSHDSLLYYRAMAIVDNPRAVRVMRDRRKTFPSEGRRWSLSEYYHSMDGFHKSYIGYLSRKNQKILKALPAGMAFVNEANAMCKRTFVGDFVVVSETLEKLFYFMTIGIFGEKFDILMADRVNALLIALRIMNGAESLDFDIDTRGDLPVTAHRAIQSLVRAQIEFTFGHEYAHYFLGHLTEPDLALHINDRERASKIFNKTFSYDCEYEADLWAIKSIEKDFDIRRRIINGAYSVFIFLQFLQEMQVSQGLRKFHVSDTHPEPLNRLWMLWESLGMKALRAREEIEAMIDTKDRMKQILSQHIQNADIPNVLSFYGSIYLPSFKQKFLIDRIDY